MTAPLEPINMEASQRSVPIGLPSRGGGAGGALAGNAADAR